MIITLIGCIIFRIYEDVYEQLFLTFTNSFGLGSSQELKMAK